jgi:lambda repressor-like predicted transcriptional regulator
MEINKQAQKQIKKQLKTKGIRLVDIAQKCGVHKSMVSHVVAGKHPGSKVRDFIAKSLETKKEILWPPTSKVE